MFLEVNDPIFLEVYGYGPIDGKIILVVCLFNEFFTTNNVQSK